MKKIASVTGTKHHDELRRYKPIDRYLELPWSVGTLVGWRENFHENELSLAVSHNGCVYAGGLTIGTTTCSMTVPFDDCNK